jgi:hypothetical protein
MATPHVFIYQGGVMNRLSSCVIVLLVASCGGPAEVDGPLPAFNGRYKITQGATGVVEVRAAVTGDYSQLHASFTNPPHDLLVIVGKPKADGTLPVWRFEQEPAPNIPNNGMGRLQNGELVADFMSADDPGQKLIRERWKFINRGELEFALEASSDGAAPHRVGGYTAKRD